MALETKPQLDRAHENVALPPAVRLCNLSVRLGDRLALRDIDLAVPRGAFVGLIGPNGSGKSTLLRAVLGIVPITAGTVQADGRPPTAARDLFSYLPQRQRVDTDLPLRACDVVMMGRIRQTGLFRPVRRHDRDVVDAALARVGLSDRWNSAIGEMSFGQQQRVFFARALAQEGSLLLLDEPMNGVDSQTQELFLELLSGFHAEGKTIIMATHDLTQAAAICDNICVLRQHLIAYGPVAEVLTEDVLRDAYGVHLHFAQGAAGPGHLLGDVHHHDLEVDL